MDWIRFVAAKLADYLFPDRLQRLQEEKRLAGLIEKFDRLRIEIISEVQEVEFGSNVNIAGKVRLMKSTIGDYSYVGNGSSIIQASIGKFCSIAGDVSVGLGKHPTKGWVSTHPLFYLNRPELGWSLSDKDYLDEYEKTVIGHDVWIGFRVAVKDGVTIGNGAIIGAGAVVVSDVEPYAIYGGVPAKLIRYRFSEEQIRFLQELKWWDRDENWLKQNVRLMHDIDHLMERYGRPLKFNDGQ
jgi:acetyltransferase-like isoleucine patch superfamily enzyme